MYSVKSHLIAGPKPDWVSDEVHRAAQAYVPRMQEIYSDPDKSREWYLTVPPEVYDETMRILNFNDPFYLIDQLVEPED